jgi:hypothetical protein
MAEIRIGEVYRDTYMSTEREPWLAEVIKLNPKSARVRDLQHGYEYRVPFGEFRSGRQRRESVASATQETPDG